MDIEKYILGCLIGGWVGDAAGATLEFYHKEITEEKALKAMKMNGGGVFNVGPGQITDDSELELSLLNELLNTPKSENYPLERIAQSYIEWGKSNPFDKGRTCSNAFCTSQNHEEMIRNSAMLNFNSKSNGALMRSAPIGIWSRDKTIEEIIKNGKLDAKLSHPNEECQEANAIYALIIAYLIKNPEDNEGAIEFAKKHVSNMEVEEWIEESCKFNAIKNIDCKNNIGYVKHGFSLAIYFLKNRIPYEEAIKQTLMKGGDTDTNAKIVGSVLGALYGIDSIPKYMMQPVLDFDCENVESGKGHKRPKKYNIKNIINKLNNL